MLWVSHKDNSFEYPQHMFGLMNKNMYFQLGTLRASDVACHCRMISKYGASLSKAVGQEDVSFLVVKKSHLNTASLE